MKQKETKFKEKVMKALDGLAAQSMGGLWYTKIQQVARRGDPDFIICVKGIFFAWELKQGKGKASLLQQYKLEAIDRALGVSRIVTPENFYTHFAEVVACLKDGGRGLNPSSWEQEELRVVRKLSLSEVRRLQTLEQDFRKRQAT